MELSERLTRSELTSSSHRAVLTLCLCTTRLGRSTPSLQNPELCCVHLILDGEESRLNRSDTPTPPPPTLSPHHFYAFNCATCTTSLWERESVCGGRGRVTVVRWEGGSALLKLMQSRRHLLLELSLKDAVLTHYLTHYWHISADSWVVEPVFPFCFPSDWNTQQYSQFSRCSLSCISQPVSMTSLVPPLLPPQRPHCFKGGFKSSL